MKKRKCSAFLRNLPKPSYSGTWYERFKQNVGWVPMTDQEIPYENDPAWLTLPLGKRENALRRRKAMLDYEKHQSPGEDQAHLAAKEMGLTMAQFYRLRRQWIDVRSIFSLIPFGKPGSSNRKRVEPTAYFGIRDIIQQSLLDGKSKPADILRAISDGWTSQIPLPSHMTLRRLINNELEALEGLPPLAVLDNSEMPQETLEIATTYGEAVVIDHVPLSVFLAHEAGPVVPILSVGLDLFTKSIVGYHLSASVPGPAQVLATIEAAEDYTRMRAPEREAIRPKLIFSCTHASVWKPFLSRLTNSALPVHIRKTQVHHFGGMARRMIGTNFGDLKLLGRQRLSQIFDERTDALVSLPELTLLVEQATCDLNERRAGANFRPLQFGI